MRQQNRQLWLSRDNATGNVANALFRPEEDTRGYLLLMEGFIRLFGIPLAIYGDCQGVLTLIDKPRHVPQPVTSTRRTTRPHSPARRLECSPKPVAREMHATPSYSATKTRDSYISLPTAWRSGEGWPPRTRISADQGARKLGNCRACPHGVGSQTLKLPPRGTK